MTDKTSAEKRATTRKVFKLINDLKGCIDFKTLTFIKQGDGYSGIIIMFDEAIIINDEVK